MEVVYNVILYVIYYKTYFGDQAEQVFSAVLQKLLCCSLWTESEHSHDYLIENRRMRLAVLIMIFACCARGAEEEVSGSTRTNNTSGIAGTSILVPAPLDPLRTAVEGRALCRIIWKARRGCKIACNGQTSIVPKCDFWNIQCSCQRKWLQLSLMNILVLGPKQSVHDQ